MLVRHARKAKLLEDLYELTDAWERVSSPELRSGLLRVIQQVAQDQTSAAQRGRRCKRNRKVEDELPLGSQTLD